MLAEITDFQQHWEESGAGEPLLWLHGALGHGADWQFIFSEPPPGFHLIAPDLRGHGASTNPSGRFTFRQAALDTLGLVDHLGLQTIKAIGLSGGGITLLHLATIRPSLLESMIVISAPLTFPERARAIQRHYSPAAVGDAEMARMRQRHRQGESQIEQLFAMVRALADDREDVNFTPEQLARISAKTLIVFGDRDFLYPVSAAFELHRAIKGSYLWVVPNGAHGPVFGDAAPEFVRVALQFLRGGWQ